MKRLFLLTLFFALMLSACGGVKATVNNNPYAKASQAIVEKWITTLRNRDTKASLALYSDDMTYNDCSKATCDQVDLSQMKYLVPSYYADPGFKVEVQSYFVTKFGEKAVLQVIASDPNVPVTNAPAVVILEIKDGKIVKETWIYGQP